MVNFPTLHILYKGKMLFRHKEDIKMKKAKYINNCWDFFVELVETFKDLWLMHLFAAIGCLPGFGIFISAPVVGLLNIILKPIQPLAHFFCSTYYLEYPDATEAWLASTTDMFRIWIITFILITTIRFAYNKHVKRKNSTE